MLLLPHEHSHAGTDDLVRPGMSLLRLLQARTLTAARQSGQSLIEHSYKADSDLSPAGWEYADRLKAAVMSRRREILEEKRARGDELLDEAQERKLVIWTSARRRAHHTAWPFVHSGYKVVQKPQMSEINPCVPPCSHQRLRS